MKQRITYLDGLRGMASLIVVFHHMLLGFYLASNHPESILYNSGLRLLVNGDVAVVIFLLLSGYVVGLKDSTPSLLNLMETIVKRFFRFVMPILTTHLIVVMVLWLGWHWNGEAAQITSSYSWLGEMWQMKPSLINATTQAVLSLFRDFPRDTVYNSSTWTMPFFFLGPLGLMVFLSLIRPKILRIGLLFLGVALLIKTYYWPILLGYLLARSFRIQTDYPRWLKMLLLVVVVVLGNYPYYVSTAQDNQFYRWLPIFPFANTTLIYQALAATALILLLTGWSWLQQLFNSRWMLFLGKISFSLYLFHLLIINTITSGLFLILHNLTDNQTAFGISLLVSLPIILTGSVWLYRFAELPSQAVAQAVLQWNVWRFLDSNKKLSRN